MSKYLKKVQSLCLQTTKLHSQLFTLISSPQNFPSQGKFTSNPSQELTSILSQLKSNDDILKSFISNNTLPKILEDLQKDMKVIKYFVIQNIQKVKKDVFSISTILKEYKERCQHTLLEFLKSLDVDLRKALKPLVPVKVLQEQLKFKPINPERLLSSLRSNPPEEEKHLDSTVDKLNNHIQLLINTLETVAKDLISITQNTNQKYYEIVDPLALYSEPPSPLAAPLPDYFSFDLSVLVPIEDNYKPGVALSAHARKKILSKMKNLSKDPNFSPQLAERLHEKFEKIFKENLNEIDLLGCLKEEGVPISEREKIVFDIIHTDRTSGVDANIEDMILADELDKRDNQFEVSKTDYSQILKNIEGKELTDRYEDRSQFGSLQSSIDEKVFKAKSKKELVVRKKNFTPVLLNSENKTRSRSKLSQQGIKIKEITPNKAGIKSGGKRSHTPGLKKSKKK